MFTTKRKLLNEQVKVKNRDKQIEDFKNKLQQQWKKYGKLELENEELKHIIKEIYNTATSNNYNNDKAIIRKIIELAKTANQKLVR